MNKMIWILGALLIGCGGAGGSTAQCVDNGQCNAGQGCLDGQCVAAECIASTECGLGQFCSQADFSCKEGCLEDSDCFAGEECNAEAQSCQSYGCRSTALDCKAGEYCDLDRNSASYGECYKDTTKHCKLCDFENANSCPNGMECYIWDLGETGCFTDNDCPNNWKCDLMSDFQFYCHQDRCLADCNPNDTESCPSGFKCRDLSGFGDYQCAADCGYLKDAGIL